MKTETMYKGKKGKLKNITINCMLVLCSLLICCTGMEIGLRLSGYGAVGKREGNRVRHVTNEFEHDAVINSLGLRNPEIVEKEPDEFRILAVGDSFAYGLGVEENRTFVRQTEKLLRDFASADNDNPKKFCIINCGGVGGGPWEQREWLKHVSLSLNPDTVVQSFFIGNDVYDDMAWRRNNRTDIQQDDTGIIKYRRKSLEKIVFFDWLWFRLINIPFLDKLLFDCGLRYTNRGLFLKELPDLEKKGLNATLKAISDINNTLKNKHIRFLVMIIPTSDQVRYGSSRPVNEDYRQPNKILVSFFKKHDIEYIDLLPFMEKEPDKSAMYYARDLHWTDKGHTFASKLLAGRIRSFSTDSSTRPGL